MTTMPIEEHSPYDPSKITVLYMIPLPLLSVTPGASVRLTRNWKRLEKPGWVWPTILIQVAILAGLILGGVLLAVQDSENAFMVALSVLIVSGIANTVFWVIVRELQVSAYKAWIAAGRTPQALRQHRYRLRKNVAIALLAWGPVALGMIAFAWYVTKPVNFENDHLSLSYEESFWKSTSQNQINFCSKYDTGCFLVLLQQPYRSTTIAFVERPLNGQGWTLAEAEKNSWESIWARIDGLKIVARSELQIDGEPAVSREFLIPQDGGDPVYTQWFLVLHDGSWYEITAWSSSPDMFEKDRQNIIDVIKTIKFKTPA